MKSMFTKRLIKTMWLLEVCVSRNSQCNFESTNPVVNITHPWQLSMVQFRICLERSCEHVQLQVSDVSAIFTETVKVLTEELNDVRRETEY
jgi:hypothetical protein